MKYVKSDGSPRLTIQFLDEKNQLLFEVKNRTWMDVGEVYTEKYMNNIIETTLPNSVRPEVVRLLLLADYYKEE